MGIFCPSCSPSCRICCLRKCFIHLSKRSAPRSASALTADAALFDVQISICYNCHLPSQYPEWLETNKPTLSAEDYQRFDQQAKIMGDICQLFEKEEEGGEDKERTFEHIMELMQKVMEPHVLSHIFI